MSIVDKDGNIARDISSIYVTFYLNKNNSFADPQSGDIYKTVLMQNGTATADFTNEKFSDSGNVITATANILLAKKKEIATYYNCNNQGYNNQVLLHFIIFTSRNNF